MRAKKTIGMMVMGFVVVMVSLSCAPAGQSREVPDWVIRPPQSTSEYEYFVVSASDPAGDVARAEESAGITLIGDINRVLGVSIDVDITAEERLNLEEYEASVVQTVRTQAEGLIAGFRVADRFVLREGDRVTVYLLGQYDQNELAAERRKRQSLIQQQEDAIDVPEAEGDRLADRGELFGALQNYIQAAAAASISTVRGADVSFERNINNANAVLAKITLEKLTDRISGQVREAFAEPFVLAITNDRGVGIPNAQVTVSYREMNQQNRVQIRSATLTSDDDGIVNFVHPVPTIVGTERVTMALDLTAFMLPLDGIARPFRSLRDSLQDSINSKRVAFEYTATSRGRAIPTGIAVIDIDPEGLLLPANATAGGILQSLSEGGFAVRALNVAPSLLATGSDADILDQARADFGDQVQRMIIGIGRVVSVDDRDGFIVRVSGSVKVFDLTTDAILLSRSLNANARASGLERALAIAFNDLGTDLGTAISRDLP